MEVHMFKKILVPLILALVAALVIGGVAYAADQPGKDSGDNPAVKSQHRGLGQITKLGDSQLTVQLKRGVVKVIHIDENTRYIKADGSVGSFADLQVGLWVAGRVIASANGPLARLVIILPDGFNPSVRLIRHVGTIIAVDPAASSFDLKSHQGESLTFQVDSTTQFFGKLQSLVELKPGMQAVVGATQLEDGSYLAVRVTAREKPQVDVKVAGRVTAIDVASFTILGRDGKTYTFQVTPETRFRSRGGQVKGLKDLQLGMGVGVSAQNAGDGQLKALVVVANVR
jgi:hypothetical protein